MDISNSLAVFHQTVLNIHSKQNVYDLRTTFLRDVEKLIPHEKSIFDMGCYKKNKIIFFDPVSLNIDEKMLSSYYTDFEMSDFMSWFFYQSEQNVYRDSELISDAVRVNSVVYKNWMRPQDIYYSIGSRLAQNGKFFGSVTLFRSKVSGDFTVEDTLCLEYLNDHLVLNFIKCFPNGIEHLTANSSADQLTAMYRLSRRESEIVERIYRGMRNKEIADTLFLSESTVKKHIYSIFKKMGIDSRAQLVKIVCDNVETNGADSV